VITKTGTYKKAKVIEATGLSSDNDKEIWERTLKYSGFGSMGSITDNICYAVDEVIELDLDDITETQRSSVVNVARSYDDKQYYGTGTFNSKEKKSNTDYFYCSKLVWRAYKNGADTDVDHDDGFYVTPGDIENDWDIGRVKRFIVN